MFQSGTGATTTMSLKLSGLEQIKSEEGKSAKTHLLFSSAILLQVGGSLDDIRTKKLFAGKRRGLTKHGRCWCRCCCCCVI